MTFTEWSVQLKCKRCKRSSYGYFKARRLSMKAIGCKQCGLNTTIEVKESQNKIGQLDISIYIPYYC